MSPDAKFYSETSVNIQKVSTFLDMVRAGDSPAIKRIKLDEGGSTGARVMRVMFRLFPPYQILTCSRILMNITRASR